MGAGLEGWRSHDDHDICNLADRRTGACGCRADRRRGLPALAQSFPESQDPIRLTLHDWTGQYITTRIMGSVLEEMGYNIEYVQADYLAQFAGLESGDLHVAMEIWETTGKDALEASLATGDTVELGETGMEAIEEWWYPLYVKEDCPGCRLGGAQRLRRAVRHAADQPEGALSWRPGDLGRL
jgi:ABC-type proline/glycine betaine transport system substrate-binding protein